MSSAPFYERLRSLVRYWYFFQSKAMRQSPICLLCKFQVESQQIENHISLCFDCMQAVNIDIQTHKNHNVKYTSLFPRAGYAHELLLRYLQGEYHISWTIAALLQKALEAEQIIEIKQTATSAAIPKPIFVYMPWERGHKQLNFDPHLRVTKDLAFWTQSRWVNGQSSPDEFTLETAASNISGSQEKLHHPELIFIDLYPEKLDKEQLNLKVQALLKPVEISQVKFSLRVVSLLR